MTILKHSLLILLIVTVYSCSKTSTASGNGGTWTAQNTTYTASSTSRSGTSITFTDATHGTNIICTFYQTIPTANTTFTMIDYAPNNYNQMEVSFFNGTHTYLANSIYSPQATVSVGSNGKLSITFLSAEFDYSSGVGGIDTLYVAGSMHEI